MRIFSFSGRHTLLLGTLAYFGCNLHSGEKAKSPRESLEIVVEEDLQDGIPNVSEIELNLPDLPKTKFVADRDHSSISFRTKHWDIVDIIGWFSDFVVIMYSDSIDFSDAVVYARVDPQSLIMPNPKMQQTAQKIPYLDVDKYPEVTFLSRAMAKDGEHRFRLTGEITLNGISREVVFTVLFNGFAYPGEKSICGFEVEGKIDRSDFKVGGDDKLHSGRQVHGDTINLFMALRME